MSRGNNCICWQDLEQNKGLYRLCNDDRKGMCKYESEQNDRNEATGRTVK